MLPPFLFNITTPALDAPSLPVQYHFPCLKSPSFSISLPLPQKLFLFNVATPALEAPSLPVNITTTALEVPLLPVQYHYRCLRCSFPSCSISLPLPQKLPPFLSISLPLPQMIPHFLFNITLPALDAPSLPVHYHDPCLRSFLNSCLISLELIQM